MKPIAAGVPKSDVEILNLRSQDVRASPKVTDGITYAVMAAIVFDNRATASKWAGNLADMLKVPDVKPAMELRCAQQRFA